jgi:hypothetical protein
MRILAVSLFAATTTLSASTPPPPPPAYSADNVVMSGGKPQITHIWSDGTHVRTVSADGTSGNFSDQEKKLGWTYGPEFGCVQYPMQPEGATSKEEVVGNEMIDGHPTKKFKVTSTFKEKTSVMFEWRATDLHDLPIKRKMSDNSFDSHLEHIVMGKPDPKFLAFPSPPCKYEAALDTSHNAPQVAGGFRVISFSDASCKNLVPLPITLSIPSDYAIRGGGPRSNCFWGASDDLDRAIGRDGFDFEHIHRGVFWCRPSDSTEYDPVHDKFVSEQGTQDQWSATMKSMGAKNVSVTSKKIGKIPSARVTASMNGQRVYMLYLAVPNADSPAILINYHPAGKGGAADDAEWARFIESIAAAR